MKQDDFSAQENVDPEEIKKFEALASRWWDKNSEFKPLHDINPLRLNYIDEKSRLNGKTVLDVGCGGGILSEAMAIRGACVTGIDMGEAPLKVAKLHSLDSGVSVNYRQITAEALASEQPESFDIVTCLEMLEHVPQPAFIVEACAQLVKPGGHVFFSTINKTAKSWLFAIVGAEYILKLLPKGTHQWSKFISPHTLANDCHSNGLTVKHMTGMTYNPITKQYRLKEGELGVNYIMHTTRG
ncbi:MAG: bifunctional 2-polyprenyl-6-hydroxyphenol methylase/3-demethylubiquinol 3-O-methyltransferase UbiG [Endozoicomonadaceae bacterium]|nr:bifunctional 2-polyprenyl-6-hydroxyphenol methylase/3-demethylubiquinol 3-O-methyltransferase UbiG [Endozoicomonadaceae bacterium]MCY4329168.1 bifunctional 2-polyprenyl-6-hydroxyphenol methylase/3-demethylubiquinol 3-O-methyltransferase UbiG [Endozoicomonadaceae bacterium]